MMRLPMKKELVVERDETSAKGSTTSSVHSVLSSRMGTKKQPLVSCCKFEKGKQFFLFDEAIVPIKAKSQSNPEQGKEALFLGYEEEATTSEISFISVGSELSEARKKEPAKRRVFEFLAYSPAEKEKKQASSSAQSNSMAVKRKAPEQGGEEEDRVSLDYLPLSLVHQGKIKKRGTSGEIMLSLRTHKEVSTKLTLFDETWPIQRMQASQAFFKQLSKKADVKERAVISKIAAMKLYKPGEERAERQKGVSTKLGLLFNPWNTKKKLTPSDLGHLSRLLLNTSLVEEHVLPMMNVDSANLVESRAGLLVTVWDCDTGSLHQMVFRKWLTSKSYILNGNWVKDFVKRRNLKEGDEIGLYWDSFYSRFNFSVLDRAPMTQLVTADETLSSGSKNC